MRRSCRRRVCRLICRSSHIKVIHLFPSVKAPSIAKNGCGMPFMTCKSTGFWQGDYSQLPPALVMVGELDVLRTEGEQYAEKLQKH
jgi:acetyl esterase/lipase